MLFLDEKTCIDFLEANGYYVYKVDSKSTLVTSKDLVKYFFSKFKAIDYSSILWKVEAHYASVFIKQMSHNGNEKDKVAMSQCKYVIDTIADNLDIFDKYYTFNSLKILAAKSGYWVIEKCFALDKNKINERTGYTSKEWDSLQRTYEQEVEEKQDLNKIKIELNKILGDK